MPPWIWIARSQARTALALEPRRPLDHEPRGVELGGHVGEVVLDRLELADDLAERRALARVGERGLVGGRAAAERGGAAEDALVVERGQELVEAAPLLAQHRVGRQGH